MRFNHYFRRSLLIGSAAILSAGFASTALADEAPAASDAAAPELDVDEDEIVVTATATGVNLRDAPASIAVITHEEIERQPVQSIGELLGRLPGVTGGISPTGAMSKISIRGLPDNYTLMLVDGRRIGSSRDITYRPDMGRQGLNWISPDMIERIEVVRGPMSSIYGSDAMGGVINIITRKIAPTWRGSSNSSYTKQEDGDRGDAYQIGLNVRGPVTQNLGLRIGGTYARTNPDEMDISGDNGTAGVSNSTLNGQLNWQPVKDQTFSVEASYGVEDPVAPSETDVDGDTQSSWGAKTERVSLRAGHEGKWGFGTSRIDIYHNTFKNEDESADGGTSEFKETIVEALFNFELSFLAQHKIALGGQYRDEELTNTRTIGTIPIDYDGNVVDGATLSGDTAAIFAEDQITLMKDLNLTLGGRLDHHHRYGSNFSPRAYVVWHPIEAVTVKGGVSRGFRAPSLKENSAGAATFSRGGGCGSLTGLGYTSGGCYMAGNPDLEPEKSTNYEIGLAYDSAPLSLSATYFNTKFKNKIEYAPLGYFEGLWWTMMSNVERARTEGVEMTGKVKFLPSLSLRGNVTWMAKAKNLDTGEDLITAPEWSAFSSLDWSPKEDVNLFLTGQYTGKQLGAADTITKGYWTFDLGSSIDVSESVTLRAGVRNLFDKMITGDSDFSYYSPGRRYFIGVTSRF
ncbi:TonB-dependent receptor [Altericroceibacterium spongiae]|uniref:TonB-dependent receptor n=1 Tax=Altericroceibacterium spongiae TaxID=2320269 RepID=A0A420EAB7_9SPHN|nr:TonB-dependent receptor [Altericroceibacterium spongiae]RKF17611.1 TonB-dependent receptor [Altericroceibacterium spongiae]